MTTATILIVEDEHPIRDMLRFALHASGYQTVEAADSGEARVRLAEALPDLILLDWMLPGVSGIEFARQLKREELTSAIPIILLTAKVEEEYKIQGLDGGADDYITKPFSTRELVARMRAVLRRTAPSNEDTVLQVGELRLDTAGHRVTLCGQTLSMGPTEYRLLAFFMAHPDRVYSRSQLLDRVWGRSVYVEERTVDVHIRRLRKALETHNHSGLIQTVRGAGYRFSNSE
jgi:two-component system phosphate regulon response regulator PhoB